MNSFDPQILKADVEALCNFCIRLRAHWRHFQILYERTELERELLERTAQNFFGDLNHLLIEHLILQICKITDEAKTGAHENLTVKFLIEKTIPFAASEEVKALNSLSGSIHAFRAKIVSARNKYIGHLDRASVLEGKPLGQASPAEWNQFWLDLQEFLHIMHKRYVDPNSVFYLNGVIGLSDAEALIDALRESTFYQILENDKSTMQKCVDVATSSKFSKFLTYEL
jgi:hypothetical protein